MPESDEADVVTESTGQDKFCAKVEEGLVEELENICDRAVGKEFSGSLNTNCTQTVQEEVEHLTCLNKVSCTNFLLLSSFSFFIFLLLPFSDPACGGLTLAGCQVPTKASLSFSSSAGPL